MFSIQTAVIKPFTFSWWLSLVPRVIRIDSSFNTQQTARVLGFLAQTSISKLLYCNRVEATVLQSSQSYCIANGSKQSGRSYCIASGSKLLFCNLDEATVLQSDRSRHYCNRSDTAVMQSGLSRHCIAIGVKLLFCNRAEATAFQPCRSSHCAAIGSKA